MKLIEKKCPNCGASLSFDENDRSCRCDYCKRSFEIERDSDNIENIHLLMLPFFRFSRFLMLIPVIVFCIVFVCFFFFAFRFVTNSNNNFFDAGQINFFEKFNESVKPSNSLLTDISGLSGNGFKKIDLDARMEIATTGNGVQDAYHSYYRDGDPKREKTFLAYKDDSNYVIAIYKVIYYDFFHQEDRYTVFVPLIYENVENYENVEISDMLSYAEVKAPEYQFKNAGSYTYGYGSYEDAYNDSVKPLEKEYEISAK